ncbi:hypothetical protein [Rhizobium sp. R339]|uniref:hypothetical protein n=1 Tax=Rhizobium sp. R339 TaxID=1764273 RepID=UPI00167D6898|nr:hypothetical protein [Rhizobium sp. R339]
MTAGIERHPSGEGREGLFRLVCHDAFDLFLIALLIDKELPNTAAPGADIGWVFSRSGEKWKSAAGGAPPAKGWSSRT